MLQLPQIFNDPQGKDLHAIFRETLATKEAFYQETSTEKGQAYIKACQSVRERLLKEADTMQQDAGRLAQDKFKGTIVLFRDVADRTKALGERLHPVESFVAGLIQDANRPTTWGAAPVTGAQWLYIQHGACELMDATAKLRAEFAKENVPAS